VEVEYKSGSTTKTEEFDFDGAEIYLDSKKASYEDLRKGYEVVLLIKGNEVTKVEAKKGQHAFDGYFVAFNAPTSYNRSVDIEIEEETGDSYYHRSKFYSLDRYYVYINGKKFSISDLTDNRYKEAILQPGMPVRLKFNSRDEVTEIETVFNPDIKDGIIWAYINRELSYNATYLYISPSTYRYTSSGQVKTLKLPRDNYYLRVYIDTREAKIQDLKRDDWAKITMRNGEVDTIEVLRTGTSNTTTISLAVSVTTLKSAKMPLI
ncbi:MAG: hypothetical protein Q4Q17_03745, partial [Tissierellia bacterium]|nr:hypothetical protein [Tissierellia bacterium]